MLVKRFLFVMAAFFIPLNALAYVRTMSESGIPIYWAGASPSVRINPGNSSGLSSAQVSSMMNNAMGSWNNAGAAVAFSSSTSASHPTQGAYDGSNSIFFASNSGYDLGWGVVAVTEVLYFVNNGQIAEFDMIFNDRQFNFTVNEGDTGKFINGKTAIFLQDVAAHEAGHAIGLDHSMVNKSSLIYTAFSGQFNLSDDDKTGAQTIYPASGGKGAIRGNIQGLSGGIFGAQITAIDPATGRVQAAGLSNPDGSFRIGDIPAGNYLVLMEPFGADISSVTSYFQNVNHRFCGGSRFRRRFYSACGSSRATLVNVSASANTEIGTLSPSCSQMGNPASAGSTVGTAKDIGTTGGSYFGTLNTNDTHYYKIRSISGNLHVKAASYTLYSPVDVKVEILAANGASMGANSIDNVEAPMPGGYTNYDSSAQAINLPSGDYLIKVTSAALRISSSQYPAGFDLLDASGHYLLMIGLNGSFGATTTSDMSACITVNNTAQNASYRIPASGGGNEKENGGGGCASISSAGGNGGPYSGAASQALFTILFLQTLVYFAQWRRKLAHKRV